MRKIFMLAGANIRENKGQSASLVVLVFIAALLLNLGLLISVNFTEFFDWKAEQQNSPTVNVLMPERVYRDSYLAYFKAYSAAAGTQLEDVLLLPTAGFNYADGSQSKGVVVMDASNERRIMKVSFIGETLSAGAHSIYVPYLMQTGGGYKLGDDFVLTYAGNKYPFTVAGFTEDIVFSTINSSEIGFYLPEEAYRRFAEEINDDSAKSVMLSVVLEEHVTTEEITSNFMESQVATDDYSFITIENTEQVRLARTLTPGIASMIIVAVAAVIMLIGLIVIRFRIDNSIEDGMTNIGALKACGYTSRQLMGFITLQFSLLTLSGAALGIGLSYLLIPLLSDIFSLQSGLVWEQGFDPAISLCGLCFVLLVVLVVSWLSAGRINHLHPITALRGGLKTHSFRANRFPLEKTKGNLHVNLSLKRIAQNPKQNSSIALIIASVCFVAVFGLILYNNFVITDGAVRIVAGELPNVQVVMDTNTENNELLTDIAALPGVRKAIYYDYAPCTIEYQDVLSYVAEDFEQTESELLYEGRHPRHKNEVAFNGYLAELLGKKVGDTVTVTMGSAKEEYLITGFIQTSNYLGRDIEITIEGLKRLQPDYQWSSIFIYLLGGRDAEVFIDELHSRGDGRISNILDFEEYLGTFVNSYASIVRILVTVVMIIVAMVVMLILYLVIKTMILREKRAFGIQKAVGYTTWQLMRQIALTLLPVVSVGIVLGAFLGYYATNPILSVLFKNIGVMKVSFVIPPLWVAILSAGILLLAYAVSMLVAWRIHKISVYELISE